MLYFLAHVLLFLTFLYVQIMEASYNEEKRVTGAKAIGFHGCIKFPIIGPTNSTKRKCEFNSMVYSVTLLLGSILYTELSPPYVGVINQSKRRGNNSWSILYSKSSGFFLNWHFNFHCPCLANNESSN